MMRNLRLLVAETLIHWAFHIMPNDAKEKALFARAIQIYELDVTRHVC